MIAAEGDKPPELPVVFPLLFWGTPVKLGRLLVDLGAWIIWTVLFLHEANDSIDMRPSFVGLGHGIARNSITYICQYVPLSTPFGLLTGDPVVIERGLKSSSRMLDGKSRAKGNLDIEQATIEIGHGAPEVCLRNHVVSKHQGIRGRRQ